MAYRRYLGCNTLELVECIYSISFSSSSYIVQVSQLLGRCRKGLSSLVGQGGREYFAIKKKREKKSRQHARWVLHSVLCQALRLL